MAKMKHTMNGDQQNGWYCYACDFTTRDVEAAAAHDGMKTDIEDESEFLGQPKRGKR